MNFLSIVRHTQTILSEEFDDVDNSDDDSLETYDVEEVMAVVTINEASPTTEHPEHVAVLCAAAEDCTFIKKKQRRKYGSIY